MPVPDAPKVPKANRGPSAGPENRLALLRAAREVFAESGYTAPLSAVARRAGVGQGSLYRHFPDRIALAIAVFEENMTELEALAASPEATLDDLLGRAGEQAMAGSAFLDLITSDRHDPRLLPLGKRIGRATAAVVERERQAGRVSPSVSADDVQLALLMLAGALGSTDPEDRPAVAGRARALFAAAFSPRSSLVTGDPQP